MPRQRSEKEHLERARRQLLVVGVVCVMLIVAVLWILGLRRQFERTRQRYPSTLESLRGQQGSIESTWSEFQNQLDTLQ